MPPEIVSALIGLAGIILGVIPTYLFMRQKSLAEIEKTRAEADKTKAEAEKIRVEIQAITRTKESTGASELTNFHPGVSEATISVERFPTNEQALKYMADRFRAVQKQVELAHLSERLTPDKSPERANYNEARSYAIRNPNIKFNHLSLLTNQRLKTAYQFCIVEQTPYYNVRFYSKCDTPSFTFTIFDREEVVVRPPYQEGDDGGYIAIRNQEIVGLFTKYYEQLWRSPNATGLKSEDDFTQLKKLCTE